jgi:hypothetical protein
MKQILWFIALIAMVWTIIFIGTILEFLMLGLQIISVMLLFASFTLIKKYGRHAWSYLLAMDVVLALLLFILYSSRYFLTYFQHGSGTTELLIVTGSFVISQVVGIFWGRQFYIDEHKK